MLPHIADNGFEGRYPFAHIDRDSEDGSWAFILAHGAHSITVMPDMTAQPCLDAAEGGGDTAPAFVPDVACPFHSDPNAQTDGEHHA